MLDRSRRRRSAATVALLMVAVGAGACKPDEEKQDPDRNPIFHLGAEALHGEEKCPPSGPTGSLDRWNYQARLTDAAGLVLDNLRLGPRLMARQISVPYLRIRTADTIEHTGYLTANAQHQPDLTVTSSLVDDVRCGEDDGDRTITANYHVEVHSLNLGADVTVNVEQQYRFSEELDRACEASHTAACKRFWPTIRWSIPDASQAAGVSVSVVQRFDLDPDDGTDQGSGGGADLVRDALTVNKKWRGLSQPPVSPDVDDLAGASGHLRTADSRLVLNNGAVPKDGWENYHQTSRHSVGLPSALNAGCTECVHAHWSWFDNPSMPASAVTAARTFYFAITKKLAPAPGQGLNRAVANLVACKSPSCWSDGKPEIREGSRQTACIGWTTFDQAPKTPVDWCNLDKTLKVALNGKPPVMFWDVTSRAADRTIFRGQPVIGDAYWEKLPEVNGKHRPHGGNGSFFFVPARKLAASKTQAAQWQYEGSAKSVVAIASPLWPARQDGTNWQPGKWVLPVRFTLNNKSDQGPYYLRVKTTGVNLVNPDGRYSAGGGGAPWVGIRNDTVAADGTWHLGDQRKLISRYADVASRGGLIALLAFDSEPKPGQVAVELDAAPDGTGNYVPSTGDWDGGQLAAPVMESRLKGVDWLAVAGPDLNCDSDPETVLEPIFGDVTGDGVPDAFVSLDCYTGDNRYPTTIEVYDGASDRTAPKLLGRLLNEGEDAYLSRGGCLTFGERSVTVHARGYRPEDPAGLPTLLITKKSTWSGDRFTGTAPTTADAPEDMSEYPGCD